MFRLGIAGIGMIAMDYLELICSGQVPSIQITAMSSRSPQSMERAVAAYPVLAAAAQFTNYEAMLDSGSVDGVMICTPHMTHPAMTLAALERGLPVLVEKPVGVHMEEVRAVQSLLQQRPELVCGVMYNRRMAGAYRKVKALLEQGVAGDLVRATWLITNLYRTHAYYGTSPWRGTWSSEGGGILMTQASHQLDLLQWLCGMPSKVLARCSTVDRNIQVENEAELFLEYPNGPHGHFIASAHECPGTNLLELCGTKGRITIREDSEVRILQLEEDERTFARTCPSPFDKVAARESVLTFDDSDNKVQQAAMLENFAQAALGNQPLACPFDQGVHSLEIIQGAYLSSWTGRTCPLPPDTLEFYQHYKQHC